MRYRGRCGAKREAAPAANSNGDARNRVAFAILLLALGSLASAHASECDSPDVDRRIETALQEIAAVVDPCGDAAAITRVVEEFRRCERASIRVCIDANSPRSFVDPGVRGQPAYPTALTWNPELRSELEAECDGDPSRSVHRDPNASLLHEIVHVVQDCNGLDPGTHESEAVRIENIYRRGRGLCQRTRYGSRPLPDDTFIPCSRDACSCPPAIPVAPAAALANAVEPKGDGPASLHAAGDTVLGAPAAVALPRQTLP